MNAKDQDEMIKQNGDTDNNEWLEGYRQDEVKEVSPRQPTNSDMEDIRRQKIERYLLEEVEVQGR